MTDKRVEAIVIGVSAGGLDAMQVILPALPADFSLPIVVVQHRDASSDDFLSRFLDNKTKVRVKEADDGEALRGGVVYIAPANYHLLVEADKTFSLSIDPRVNFARPSIDVLFETAAEAYGPALVGVVLTGANRDGSAGLKLIKEYGGLAVVQDPASAEVKEMPLAAIAAVAVDHVLPLKEIGPFLAGLHKSGR